MALHDGDPLATGRRAEDDRVAGCVGVSVGLVTMFGEHFVYFLGRDLTGSDDVLVIAVRVIFDIPGDQVDVYRPDPSIVEFYNEVSRASRAWSISMFQ